MDGARTDVASNVHTGPAMEPINEEADDLPIMPTATTSSPRDDDALPPDDPPDESPTATGVGKAATVLAWLALPLLAASAVLFTLPVDSPGVQQCGSPAVFLLKATSDKPLFDTNGKPLNGWNAKELKRAYERRCSKQVARRAVPAGIALVAFWVVALVAALLGWATRRALRIRINQDLRDAAYESAPRERLD